MKATLLGQPDFFLLQALKNQSELVQTPGLFDSVDQDRGRELNQERGRELNQDRGRGLRMAEDHEKETNVVDNDVVLY